MNALSILERIERLFSWNKHCDNIIKEHTKKVQDSLAESELARKRTEETVSCLDDSIRCDITSIKNHIDAMKNTVRP